MIITNNKKAEISYRHEQEIQKIFKNYINGELCINHFSINVFYGNGQNIFLSPTPKMAEELCKKNFVNFDSNYKSETYTQYELYPWRSVQKNEMDSMINHIKEDKFGMRNGMMLVRNLGDNKFVMYSFATHKKANFDGQFYFLYHCKANYIAQMGDFMYNELLPIINEYSEDENMLMPKIEKFNPINLERNFTNELQHELFYSINQNSNLNFLKTTSTVTNSLKLLNKGKVN